MGDLEVEVADGGKTGVAFGEVFDFDHEKELLSDELDGFALAKVSSIKLAHHADHEIDWRPAFHGFHQLLDLLNGVDFITPDLHDDKTLLELGAFGGAFG